MEPSRPSHAPVDFVRTSFSYTASALRIEGLAFRVTKFARSQTRDALENSAEVGVA